jgi:hypothetical protein
MLTVLNLVKIDDTDQESLISLGSECKSIATELLEVLHRLRLKDGATKWDSFLQALKAEWKSTQIDALRVRLERIAEAVNARFTGVQLNKLLIRLEQLQEENRRLESSRSTDIAALKNSFEELFRDLGRGGETSTDKEVLAQTMSEASEKGLQYSAEQVILESLRFDRLEDRYSDISKAHRSTLKWLFGKADDTQRHLPFATFAEWLASEDDLYWVSGKPGSGKSTLMKFLFTEPQTEVLLRAMANNKKVIIAEYFFWNAGKNILQRSQEGLIRSLLYQTLRSRPDLIQVLFPDAWRHCSVPTTTGALVTDPVAAVRFPLDTQSLLGSLTKLCCLLAASETRVCFFIDGLDEYEGDTRDVITLIGELRKLPLVKICVSSRPWNEFEEAFGKRGTAKLYMQDFNGEDITGYIHDVFLHDENFQELEDKDTKGKALITEIVDSAKGVFLWVVLVVRSFQEGLRNGDSIQLLHERLRELPKELNGLFERMLFHDVTDFYRRQAAQMFFITLEAKDTLPLIAYWFLDETIPEERRPLTVQQTNKRLKTTTKRIAASCKGLLEPHYHTPDARDDPLPSAILFNWKVEFHHRTVRDYLVLPSTEALIRHWMSSGFNAHIAICKMLFCQLKTSPTDAEYGNCVSHLKNVFDYHAAMVPACDSTTSDLQPQLENMMEVYAKEVPKPPGAAPFHNPDSAHHVENVVVAQTDVIPPLPSAPALVSGIVSRSPFKRLRSMFSHKKG